MAHLIRNVSGTNRDPVYGLWRNCEDCADQAPAETLALDSVLALTEQVPGMSLEEFWEAFVGAKLEAEIRRNSGPAETS